MDRTDVDLLVVGGGINGTGIARDAAGRGLSVMLVEKDDLAGHTSSASSKLIHGGLRYLEQLEFRLVRESLSERECLLRSAPHLVRPLEFLLPLNESTRPAWMIRLGLYFYDHLGSRQILEGSRAIRFDRDERGRVLKGERREGFSYWDCRVQDSRLVVLNAIDAAERGASIRTRTEMVDARRKGDAWEARIRCAGIEETVKARALVNAAGPWAAELFERISGASPGCGLKLVKGSHIVLPRIYDGPHAFLLQNPDGRIVFVIPFEDEFTMVGTTDVEWTGAPDAPRASDGEIDYLLDTIRRNFARAPARSDIVWTFAGIRGLADDGDANLSHVTRDYRLPLDDDGAPLLSVLGGKITTYRRLAEHALDKLASYFPSAHGAWTEDAVLPGGDIPGLDIAGYGRALGQRYAKLPPELLHRWIGAYGTRAERLLAGVQSARDLGEHFGSTLYSREVDYLVSNEWARTAEDVLFRRSKLGLVTTSEEAARLDVYLRARER